MMTPMMAMFSLDGPEVLFLTGTGIGLIGYLTERVRVTSIDTALPVQQVDDYELALLQGGPDRALEMVLAMLHAKRAMAYAGGKIFAEPTVAELHPFEHLVHSALAPVPLSLTSLRMRLTGTLQTRLGKLETQGLLWPHGKRRGVHAALMIYLIALLIAGLVMSVAQLSQPGSVFLMLPCVVVLGVLALLSWQLRSRLTPLGKATLANAKVGEIPRTYCQNSESLAALSMAVALGGAGVMSSHGFRALPFELRTLRRPSHGGAGPAGSSSSCGSGCGSSTPSYDIGAGYSSFNSDSGSYDGGSSSYDTGAGYSSFSSDSGSYDGGSSSYSSDSGSSGDSGSSCGSSCGGGD
jgi:uncharacterized protein (TIGR04222 family)